MKKIVFLTATRAEFGKMKTLMLAVENHPDFECFIFVTGMHMIEKYGNTYHEILNMNFKNVYMKANQDNKNDMEITFAKTVLLFSEYVKKINPDLIVIHGDRLEALAGAIVGAFLNIKVAHIEGGEISGTIDESIRHAATKFSHIHFVSNEEAKKRIMQLGEKEQCIKVIGSPDIDIMLSDHLPSLDEVKQHYHIPFEKYAIFMFHPVVSEVKEIGQQIKTVVDALIASDQNYVVIFPNNDNGTELIQQELKRLENNDHFKIFPSICFERFLCLLKNCQFLIGNSSAGIRETCIYGVPSIDLGTRQQGRYHINENSSICHADIKQDLILEAIQNIDQYRKISKSFGSGNSTELFMKELESNELWNESIQKHFVDLD